MNTNIWMHIYLFFACDMRMSLVGLRLIFGFEIFEMFTIMQREPTLAVEGMIRDGLTKCVYNI